MAQAKGIFKDVGLGKNKIIDIYQLKISGLGAMVVLITLR